MSLECTQLDGCLDFSACGRNKDASSNIGGQLHHQHANVAATPYVEDENILVRELNSLTFQEREQVFDELHGVAKVPEETPEFLASCFQRLHDEIDKVSRSKRKAMNQAFFLKPALRTDKSFFLMFLRATCFDAKEAAQKMARYFSNKLYLFGAEKLVKDITLEDMSEDDMECINSGCYEILKEKDRAGRTIFLTYVPLFPKAKSWQNLIMCGLEDEATQIHGVVDLVYAVGIHGIHKNVTDFVSEGVSMAMDLPFRFVGMHFCYDHPRFRPALLMFQMFCTRYIRLRFRVHYGSVVECLYVLMTFGIPKDVVPVNPDGSLCEESIQLMLAKRRVIEGERKKVLIETRKQQQEKSNGFFDIPGPIDILLGRGQPFRDYPGNRRLVELVDAERSRHQAADNFQKACITLEIIRKVHDQGGRFLQKKAKGWQTADDNTARDKVSQTFRTKFSSKKEEIESPLNVSENPVEARVKRIRYDEAFLEEFS